MLESENTEVLIKMKLSAQEPPSTPQSTPVMPLVEAGVSNTPMLELDTPTSEVEAGVSNTPMLELDTPTSEVEAGVSNTPMLELDTPTSETPVSPPKLVVVHQKQTPQKQAPRDRSRPISKREVAAAHMLQERCRQLCLSTFFRERASIRSLGFTSSIGGEGKSFLAMVTAEVLAKDSRSPVTLLECNWEHPSVHDYFGFTSSPGLAEWLREECSETDIRHKIDHNLTIIPAGNGKRDAVILLQQIREKGLPGILDHSNDLLIVDLPAVVTTVYGSLAASLVDSLVIVVHAGVTPSALIAETCSQLKDLPVQGLILNQLESHIPRWIRQIM